MENNCWGCETNKRHERGEIERIVYDSEHILAHYVPDSWAEIHIRIQTKQHIVSIFDLTAEHDAIVLDLMNAVRAAGNEIIAEKGGCELIMNMGKFQNTKHFHCHVAYGVHEGDE